MKEKAVFLENIIELVIGLQYRLAKITHPTTSEKQLIQTKLIRLQNHTTLISASVMENCFKLNNCVSFVIN